MNIFRSGLLFLILSSACAWLTGCVRPPENITRIRFSIWGSVVRQEAERSMVEAFERDNPDIKVDILGIGSRYAEKIQAMLVGNVAPDVITVEMTQYDEWASRGVLLDVTEDARLLEKEATMMPVPRKAFIRDGRFYALPVNVSGLCFFVNLNALKQAGLQIPPEGLTWDWVEQHGPELSRRAGHPDAPTEYAILMPLAPLFMLNQYGANILDDLYHPTRVTVNSPEAAQAIDEVRKLYVNRLLVPSEVSSDQGTYQYFHEGKVAFFFGGRWNTPDFMDIKKFDWDVVALPKGPKGNITNHGGTGIAINKDSPHLEAARRFARFYASKAGSEICMRFGRNIPVWRESAFGDFLQLHPPNSIRHFADTMEEGASATYLYAPGFDNVKKTMDDWMQTALRDPNIPTSEILEGMEADLNRWLDRMKRKGKL